MPYLTFLIVVGVAAGTVEALFAAAQVASPVIAPGGGAYNKPVTVSMTTSTKGAEIRYTLDGSWPTQSSSLYSTPFVLAGSAAVQARAFKNGMLQSTVARAELIIGLPSRLRLVWQDNSDNEAAFEVWRKAGIEDGFRPVAQPVANLTEYWDNTVLSGNIYCYRMRALEAGGAGSNFSNVECALAP